jgi:large subunit GTPase 1
MGRKAQGKKLQRNSNQLGRALVKNGLGKRRIKVGNKNTDGVYTTDIEDTDKYKSVMEHNDLDELLSEAMMKETEFKAEKSNMILLGTQVVTTPQKAPEIFDYAQMAIPRRPAWDAHTTPEVLDRAERESFQKWRSNLAAIEASSTQKITPFEKNLNIWRQLWRVVERSHVLCQIVDARNPLLFRCGDLEEYVSMSHTNSHQLLLINKADFLSKYARAKWASHFRSLGVNFVFFSAFKEQVQVDLAAKAARQKIRDDEKKTKNDEEKLYLTARVKADGQPVRVLPDTNDVEEHKRIPGSFVDMEAAFAQADENVITAQSTHLETKSEKTVETVEASEASAKQASASVTESTEKEAVEPYVTTQPATTSEDPTAIASSPQEDSKNETETSTDRSTTADGLERVPLLSTTALLDRDELLELLTYLAKDAREKFPEEMKAKTPRACIGMVGYPNVGKSSTINVLMGCKKVSVAATPGKTKHFQTLILNDEVQLCDCPGLVFPTFLNSKADLVVNGIYPIDQLRDHIPAMQTLCDRISRSQFRLAYSLDFPGTGALAAAEVLNAHARLCGYSKGFGEVDDSKSARVMLKDMCAGKLLYCHPPPNLQPYQLERYYNSFTVDNIMTATAAELLLEPAETPTYAHAGYQNFLLDPVAQKPTQDKKGRASSEAKVSQRADQMNASSQAPGQTDALAYHTESTPLIDVPVNKKRLYHVKPDSAETQMMTDFIGLPNPSRVLTNKEKRRMKKAERMEAKGTLRKARRRGQKSQQDVQSVQRGGAQYKMSPVDLGN